MSMGNRIRYEGCKVIFDLNQRNTEVNVYLSRKEACKLKMWVHRDKTEVSGESDASITPNSYLAYQF